MEGRGQRWLLKEATEKLRPGRGVGGSQIKATQNQFKLVICPTTSQSYDGSPGTRLPALFPPHRAALLTAPMAGPCPGHWTKGLCHDYYSVGTTLRAQGRQFSSEKQEKSRRASQRR